MTYQIRLIAEPDEIAAHGLQRDTIRNRRWLSQLAVGETLELSEPEFVGWSPQHASARLRRHAMALAPATFDIRIDRSGELPAVIALRIA